MHGRNEQNRGLLVLLHDTCTCLREGTVEECGGVRVLVTAAGHELWSRAALVLLIGPTWCDGFQLKYDGH